MSATGLLPFNIVYCGYTDLSTHSPPPPPTIALHGTYCGNDSERITPALTVFWEISGFARFVAARQNARKARSQAMETHHKLIVFGFVICMIAALAYVFVFADISFVNQPVQVDGAVPPPPAPPAQ